MNKKIYVTDFDMKRFKWLFSNSHKLDKMLEKHLFKLEKELKNAIIVDPKDIPSSIITMHSKFKIVDIDTNEESVYTLVFPFDANLEENKLSVLAPIGVAVIGYSVGEIIEWEVPSGKRRIKIVEILYQPEAEGNYYI